MPILETRTYDQIMAEQARAAQATAPEGRALDFSQGSIFRALASAFAVMGMWLQGMVLRTLANTRAATSSGSDLHSWMADFGLGPNEGTRAKGNVTFGRFTQGLPAMVPALTTTVRTADGAWTYRVTINADHPRWSRLQRGYTIPAGVATVELPVEALVVGPGGNADPGTVTLLSTSVPAVDYVTNPVRLAGGESAETDDAFRARFRAFLASLPSGVTAAIEFAIASVQPGLSWTIRQGELANGEPFPATFTVVVDDGTGLPSPSLLSEVAAAIEPVRALGITYAVVAPQRLLSNVSMALTIKRDADPPSVVARVTSAIRAHIDGLPLGAGLSFTRLSVIAYGAADEVVNITEVRLNGALLDVPGLPRQAIRSGIISVTATPLNANPQA